MRDTHPLAGTTVTLKGQALGNELAGQDYELEDWWVNVFGESWTMAQGNPAALKYAMRAGLGDLPTDDEVVYGKVGGFGHLVHTSELNNEQPT